MARFAFFEGAIKPGCEIAFEAYVQSIKLDPNNLNVRENLGDALNALHRYDEAIEQFELILKEQPNRLVPIIASAWPTVRNSVTTMRFNNSNSPCNFRQISSRRTTTSAPRSEGADKSIMRFANLKPCCESRPAMR